MILMAFEQSGTFIFLAAGFVGLIAFAIVHAIYWPRMQKRARKILLKELGSDEDLTIGYELLNTGLLCKERLASVEYHWVSVESIEVVEGFIEVCTRYGTLFIRNRGFQSDEASTEFVNEARRLLAAAGDSQSV